MNKSANKEVAVPAESNLRTVRKFEFTQQDAEAAEQLGIAIGAPVDDRVTRAVVSYNMAARLAVEAGYLLLSIKDELPHGDFGAALDEMGLSPYRAAELMRMAKFATLLPAERRAQLLVMPKTKVLALADADPEIVEQILEDGDDAELADLSVRALREKIRSLEKTVADAKVDRATIEAENEGLRKKLVQESGRSSSDVPAAVADIRAEVAALVKKSELSIADIYQQMAGMDPLLGVEGVAEWVKPTAQLCMAGLVALRVQLDGAINQVAEHYGLTKLADTPPDVLAELGGDEVAQVAQQWASLVQQHRHEAALREFEREQAKPRGRGAPRKAPKAPE